MVGNRIYSTGEDIPSIQVNLVSKDTGAEIPLGYTNAGMKQWDFRYLSTQLAL